MKVDGKHLDENNMSYELRLDSLCVDELRTAIDTLNAKIEATINRGINVKIAMSTEGKTVTNLWGQPVSFSAISLTKTTEY